MRYSKKEGMGYLSERAVEDGSGVPGAPKLYTLITGAVGTGALILVK